MDTKNSSRKTAREEAGIRAEKIYIGIDPDVDKNGIAVLNLKTRKLTVKQLPFAETIKWVNTLYEQALQGNNHGFKVIIEAGWLNKSNWHLQRWDTRTVAAAKGVSQGRNEQVSRLLGEMMDFLKIPYEFKRPLAKCWSGQNRKITQDELEQVTQQKLGRMNQEGRDAALLAWDKAGFPMRISLRKTQNASRDTNRIKTTDCTR